MRFNFQWLSYLAFAALIGFTSCKKDEEVPAPTLTFTSGGTTSGSFNLGEVAEFTSNLSSTGDYTAFKATLTYKKGGSATTVTVKDANKALANIDYTKSADIKSNYEGSKIIKVNIPADADRGVEWTITVTASTSGGTSTATFTGKIVQSWTAKLLGARSNAAGSFFAPSTGEIIQAADAVGKVALIDLTYAWDESVTPNAPVIASYFGRNQLGFNNVPAAARKTQFVAATSVSQANFLDETKSWSSYFAGVTFGTNEKVTITPNNVFAFKNADGKRGLIHVDAIDDGNSGSATIRVKFE